MKTVRYYEACDWEQRGLTKETLQRFGVKCKVSSEFGPSIVEKVFFPYHNQSGKLVGYKVKDLTKEKSEKGHFYSIGHVGVDCQLFGQKTARKSAKYLFSTEGEVDTLSAYQALKDNNVGTEYAELSPAVVGIGCGTVNAVEHMANNSKFVTGYKELRLCYDNDFLTEMDLTKSNPGMKGKEATKVVGNHFMKMDVRYVDWPEWVNDCSDYLQKGDPEGL